MFKLTNKKTYLHIVVSGVIHRSDYNSLADQFNAATKDGKKAAVMLEVDSIDGIEPGVMIKDFIFGKAEEPMIKKMAIVSDKKWLTDLADIAKTFFSEETKTYPLAQKIDAERWLGE